MAKWTVLAAAALASQVQANVVVTSQPGVTISSSQSVQNDTSRPLREILAEAQPPVLGPVAPANNIIPNVILDFSEVFRVPPGRTPGPFQAGRGGAPAPLPSVAFNGLRIGFGGGGVPPDTTGDVSPEHYFQWVNTSWAIFNKSTGAVLTPSGNPVAGNSFFAGFGGLCQTTNRGDPLVLWDDAAERWVVSQFAFTAISGTTFLQCVAVSTTSDPLGSYHRYAFAYPVFNDYGKIGIWRTADNSQNAYLLTMHEFNASSSFVGESFAAVERDKMLVGQPAGFIRVAGLNTFGALPFHMEGTADAPAGACPIFAHFSPIGDGYLLWDLCLNWTAGTADFDPEPTLLASTPFALGLAGIPQLGTALRLDDFDGNSMYIAAMRPFGPDGPREAVAALTHAVDVGDDRAGAAWVQFGFSAGESDPGPLLANGFEDGSTPPPGPSPVRMVKRVVDSGTYAPGDAHRWMGSISIDQNGNLGMGYNVAGDNLNPEVRVTGRLRSDPPGQMRDEQNCSPTGTGAQTGGTQGDRPFARWGDYSSTGVDPVDDCTFWHTGEYFTSTSASSWNTRICAFKFPECGQPELVIETPSARIPVCSANVTPASFSVRVAVLGAITGNTTLSASGFPAGVTPGFAPVAVPVGGTSTVTLNGAGLLPPGLYSGSIDGVNGAANASGTVNFGVSSALAIAPVLTAPGNGSTGVSIRPTLNWAVVPGAIEYRVELSTSSDFSTVLETAVVSETNYTARNLLSVGVEYFWRVQALNFCGEGGTSLIFSFTTGQPGTCPSGTLPNVVFADDVSADAVAWVVDNQGGDAAALWTKVIPPAGTGVTTRAWYARNSATTADQRLVTPDIVLPSLAQRPLSLAFDAFHRYEVDGSVNCWDGGHVEISTDSGASWQALGNARTLTDPYPGVLSSGNPAQGESAWCRQPAGGASVRTVFNLDGFDGQTVRLRFRSTADSNTVGPVPNGWAIDNVEVKGCSSS